MEQDLNNQNSQDEEQVETSKVVDNVRQIRETCTYEIARQYEQVSEFNRFTLKIDPRPIGEISPQEATLSVKQLREEIVEFEEAFIQHDFVKQVDAIIDLQYFALGILYKMGLSPNKFTRIFDAVHVANTNKKLGVNNKRGDHGVADAEKPDGWVDPEEKIAEILSDES